MLKPDQRHRWIEKYLSEREAITHQCHSVDILNRAFVNAYVTATDAKFTVMIYGADKCPQLGRDLADMRKRYILRRGRTGISGFAGMGFPSWVWSYHLAKHRLLNDQRF